MPMTNADNPEPIFPRAPSSRQSVVWAVLIIIGAACLAVTDQSLWIDECVSAEIADHPTLKATWASMGTFPEIQLPLYMVYLWSCIQLLGTEEWFLRAIGLPWFIAGAAIFVTGIGRAVGSTLIPALLLGWNAFAWFYLNEARVYSAQLGFALALAGSAAGIFNGISSSSPSRVYWRLFLAALFLLCGSSILGAMWGFFFSAGFMLLLGVSNCRRLLRLAPGSVAMCGLGLAALAAYYGWTLTLSSRPSPVGATTPQTMVFVFYELFGAAGLGPGRYDLRAVGIKALKPFVAQLLVFGALAGLLLWHGVQEMSSRFTRRKAFLGVAVVLVPFLLVCLLGVSTPFRVLGRHASPLLPLLLIALAFGVVRIVTRWPAGGKCLAGAFLLLSLVSCLSMRFAHRHEKDDYRSAAAIAQSEVKKGRNVWWNADPFGAAFYGLKEESGGGRASVTLLMNSTRAQLAALAPPDVIIVSKPDAYDNSLAVDSYVRERRYLPSFEIPAFVIWIRTF